ncbi:MAG: anti-sigma factor family protein [Phycisphaerales bacterium]
MHERHELISMVRQAVDGELSAVEARELEARLDRDPELRAFEAFEARLREAVRVFMADEADTPADLERRVRDALRSVNGENAPADPAPRRPRWYVPSGLAAGILLIIGLSVAVSLTGRGWLTPDGGAAPVERLADELAERHDEMIVSGPQASSDEAQRFMLDFLGWEARIPAVAEAGFRLHGASILDPARDWGAGFHAFYQEPGGRGLSVFIFHAEDAPTAIREQLREGVAYAARLTSVGDGRCYLWLENGRIYIAVTGAGAPESLELAREAGLPEGEISDLP